MKTYTAYDLTQVLQATPDQVTHLLENGEIAYFMLDGQIRVLEEEVQRFISASADKAARLTAAQVLMGNQVWQNLMQADPSLAATVEALESEQNTFGGMLKRALPKSSIDRQK